MKLSKISAGLLIVAMLAISLTAFGTSVFASNPHQGTPGQPNQSCQAVFPSGPLQPPGFNTGGFGNAGNVYAGNGHNTQTPANSHAVSQYDVACFQQIHH